MPADTVIRSTLPTARSVGCPCKTAAAPAAGAGYPPSLDLNAMALLRPHSPPLMQEQRHGDGPSYTVALYSPSPHRLRPRSPDALPSPRTGTVVAKSISASGAVSTEIAVQRDVGYSGETRPHVATRVGGGYTKGRRQRSQAAQTAEQAAGASALDRRLIWRLAGRVSWQRLGYRAFRDWKAEATTARSARAATAAAAGGLALRASEQARQTGEQALRAAEQETRQEARKAAQKRTQLVDEHSQHVAELEAALGDMGEQLASARMENEASQLALRSEIAVLSQRMQSAATRPEDISAQIDEHAAETNQLIESMRRTIARTTRAHAKERAVCLQLRLQLDARHGMAVRIVQTWRHQRLLPRVFESWSEALEVRHRRRTLLMKCASRLDRQALRSIFWAWTQLWERRDRQRSLLARSVLAWNRNTLGTVLHFWAQATKSALRLRGWSVLLAQRRCSRSFAAMFRLWATTALQRVRSSELAHRRTIRQLETCFVEWMRETEILQLIRVKSEQMDRSSLRAQGWLGALEHTMASSQDSTLRTYTFRVWAAYAARIGRMRVALDWLLKGRSSTTLQSVFHEWTKYVAQKSSWSHVSRQVSQMVSSRAAKQMLSQCFSVWADYMEVVKAHTASELTRMEMESSAAARIADLEHAAAENMFTSEARAMEQEQHIRSMASLLSEMKEQLSVARAEIERCHQQRDNISSHNSRNQARAAMWQSFAAWRKETLRLRRHEQILKRVVYRLQSEGQAGAFARWTAMVSERTDQKRTLGGVVRRLAMSNLARAFNGWEQSHVKTRRLKMLLDTSIARVKHSVEYAALSEWHSRVRYMRAQRERLARCVMRLSLASLAAAFDGWQDRAHYIRAQREKLARCVMRLSVASLAAAFDGWCSTSQQQVRARERLALEQDRMASEEEMQKRTMVAASKRLLQRSLVKCLMSWQAWTAHKVSVRHLSVWMCHRLLHRQLSMAFIVWQDWLVSQVQAKRAAAKAVLHLAHGMCTRALNAWLAATRTQTTHQRTMTRVILRLHNRRAAEALDAWCSWSTEHRRLRKTGTRIIARMQHGLCARALGSWAHYCRMIARAHRMIVRWKNRVTMECFERWCEEMAATRKLTAADLQLENTQQINAEFEEERVKDKRNIQFLEALVDELFQALETGTIDASEPLDLGDQPTRTSTRYPSSSATHGNSASAAGGSTARRAAGGSAARRKSPPESVPPPRLGLSPYR